MTTLLETTTRAHWPQWAETMHRLGLGNMVAWALEAAGPLTLLGAQVFHFGSPFLRSAIPSLAMDGIIDLLENDDERHVFIKYLREAGKT